MSDKEYKCVCLKGEFKDMGNHILLPFGITLCGLPTVDAKVEEFPALKDKSLSDIISEYTEIEWNPTCDKCLEVIVMFQQYKQKTQN